MGYYSHREQVWAAAGDTVLVWDPNSGLNGAMVKWTLAGATITAMCEVTGDGTPTMRLGCSDGAIYEWPTANAYDVHESSSADFATSWVGYVSQEGFTEVTALENIRVFTRDGCSGNLSIGTRAVMSPDALPSQNTIPASDVSDNTILPIMSATQNNKALFWQVEFSSAALSTGSAKRWIVTSLVVIT